MEVVYRPEDGDEQRWTFDPGRVRVAEGEMIQKRFSGTWADFVHGVQTGDLRARRVLLWHLLRRDHHTLRYEDTPDFFVDEVTVHYTAAELTAVRSRLMKADLPEAELAGLIAAINVELSDMADDLDPEIEPGKASSAADA